MNRQWLLLALLVMSGSASAEQVYKWTDAAGITHYSDAPPPADAQNVQMMHVIGGGGHTRNTNNADATESNLPPPAASSAPATAQNAPMQDTPDNRQKNCDIARRNLALLQSQFDVATTGADGKASTMDSKQRQAQIADANAQIALFCK